MVSHRFCRELASRDGADQFDVRIIGEEPRPAYDRVHLTRFFADRSAASLELASAAWYSDHGFELRSGRRVVSIDRSLRIVADSLGETFPYDVLVLACGSAPFVPPIEGIGAPGVFVYRTINDAEAIIARCSGKSSAVVLGGGLLGLEAANAVRELGLQTTVVEFANGLMPRQLNEEGSQTLELSIRSLGVTPLLGKGARAVQGIGERLEVTFSDESRLVADALIVATGIRPRDELARHAGLSVGARGGVVVDDALATSDPAIFAIGECALHRGQIYGFVSPGYQMAEVLADRLTGGTRVFEGADTSCRLKLLGVEVSAFGDNLGQGKTLSRRSRDTYRSIVLKQDRLVGGTVVGPWDQTHQLQRGVQEGRFFSPADQALFEREGRLNVPDTLSNWPASAIVCNCAQVTKGTLSACLSSGCSTVAELSARTGAGTICGSCRPLLAQLAGHAGEETAYRPRGRRPLWIAATLAIAAIAAIIAYGPLPAPASAQGSYYRLSRLWEDDLYKQISGYTMASCSLLALGLSARKRVKRARFGNFGWWRAIHSALGTICLLALLAHTGLDFGENLNLWLMSCFVALNLAGAVTGLTVAMEDRFAGPIARRIRDLVTKAHVAFFWPYPVLLGFHIFKVYYY